MNNHYRLSHNIDPYIKVFDANNIYHQIFRWIEILTAAVRSTVWINVNLILSVPIGINSLSDGKVSLIWVLLYKPYVPSIIK